MRVSHLEFDMNMKKNVFFCVLLFSSWMQVDCQFRFTLLNIYLKLVIFWTAAIFGALLVSIGFLCWPDFQSFYSERCLHFNAYIVLGACVSNLDLVDY